MRPPASPEFSTLAYRWEHSPPPSSLLGTAHWTYSSRVCSAVAGSCTVSLSQAELLHWPAHRLLEARLERLGCLGSSLVYGLAPFAAQGCAGSVTLWEELLHTLVDSGQVTLVEGACLLAKGGSLHRLEMPDSVQAMVLARVDALSADALLTLKV